MEVNWGEFICCNINTTDNDNAISVLEKAYISKNRENEAQLLERANKVINKLKQADSDGDILIVGHKGFTSVIFHQLHSKQCCIREYRKNWSMKNAEIKEVTITKKH